MYASKMIHAVEGRPLPGFKGSRDEFQYFSIIVATGALPEYYKRILASEAAAEAAASGYYEPKRENKPLLRWIKEYKRILSEERRSPPLFFRSKEEYDKLCADGTWIKDRGACRPPDPPAHAE